MTDTLMNTYGTRELTFTRGEGVWLWDTDGNKYLDAVAGIAVCGLGHAHPGVAEAIAEQAKTLIHTSNLYNIPQQQQLADKLVALSGMENVFFSNSGAEANECAIKIARKFGHQNNIDKPVIIVMENSFHGRTMATLTATGNRKVHAGFEPLVNGFTRAPYDDIQTIKSMAENNPDIVAILVEPVQGEGGVNVPAESYLPMLRQICDDNNWLLMLDEIQTGNCRTGSFFAYQQQGFKPDVVTLAKGMANGFPIGACLATGKAAQVLQAGNHGSTYGGNPLACAASLATINALMNLDCTTRAQELGQFFINKFKELLDNCDKVSNIRGKGLMIGIELEDDCTDLVGQAAEKGLLINVTAGNTIRLLPPLIMSQDEAQQVVDTLVPLILSR